MLLTRHYDRLYGICRRLAGNDADAADATQEALIAVSKGLPKYTGKAKFSTWSYRVATNACLDELRRRGRRPTPAHVDESPGFVERANIDTTPTMSEQVIDRMVIDDALAQLPEDFRAPVVLRDHAGLDYAEIAEILDLAPGTVRSRIARGRRRLATTLKQPPAEITESTESISNSAESDENSPIAGNQPPPNERQTKQP